MDWGEGVGQTDGGLVDSSDSAGDGDGDGDDVSKWLEDEMVDEIEEGWVGVS